MRLSRRALPLALGATAIPALARAADDGPGRGPAADVTGFGARGDGVTDDGPAIQAAIDSGATLLTFPAGRYLCRRPLLPVSRQTWRGDGAMASQLLQPQEAGRPFNLVERLGSLDDVAFNDLGFVGNGRLTAGQAGDGQQGFALYLRGEQRRIALSRCRVAGFGGAGGGGVVIGPLPRSPAQALEDIAVGDCVFEDNGNVPGLYLSAGGQPGAARRGIRIVGNRFAGVRAGTRPQNCVYILADNAAARVANVLIAGNLFDITDLVDACIELNWVDGFTISGNAMSFAGAVKGSSGVLLRDGCRGGTVSGNSLRDASSEQVVAIDLLNFAHPGTIEDITISGNSVHGFSWRGIAVDRGSRGIAVVGNRITGGERRLQEALRIADARDVLVSGNTVAHAATAVMLASGDTPQAGLSAVTITGNHFSQCGGGPLIAAPPRCDIRGLVVDNNRVVEPLPGTPGLVAAGLVATPEVVIRPNLTAGLAVIAK